MISKRIFLRSSAIYKKNESEKLKNHPESKKARQECEEALNWIINEINILDVYNMLIISNVCKRKKKCYY